MKEARHKGHISYGSISMKHPEQVNPERQEVDERWAGAEGGESGKWLLTGDRFALGR